MQMIPPHLGDRKPSDAEKFAFQQLQDITVSGWQYCFHGLNLPAHAYKRACEIDFLLLGDRGLLVLEVKGGGVSCQNGIWHTLTRDGRSSRLKESPFAQAEGARLQLERQLGDRLGRQLVGRTVFGHGAVFPDIDFKQTGVEWAPEMVIDRTSLSTNFIDRLNQLGRFWEQKLGSRTQLSTSDIEAIRECLRPSFELVPGIRQLGDKVEATLHALTQRQYRVLDACDSNPRLILEGGAGTGKTMLAAEIGRRAKSSGSSVLLTCYSSILTTFLRSQPGLDDVAVVPFDKLDDIEAASIDYLVVDEAQDVISADHLRKVDRVLAGGLAEGRWAFLLDANNQRGLVGSYEQAAMKYLAEELRATRLSLIDNCRNTTEIVEATRLRTNADLGTTAAGHGEPVSVVEDSRSTLVEAVAKTLETLENHVLLSEVVLLSPFSFQDSIFNELPNVWRHRIDGLDLTNLRKPGPGRIGFAEVADFKGLERRYVLLEAPIGIDPEWTRRVLYVGMTRARANLWVYVPALPDGATQ